MHKKQLNKISNKNNDIGIQKNKLRATATHMSTDSYEEPSKLKIGSLQQNLPFKGKGWHTQQKPRATSIQPMDYREVRNRHRPSKKFGTTSREGWENSIRPDTPNSNVVNP